EGGVLLEDRTLELLEWPARLKAQLLPQQLARLPVFRERVGLPTSAIQREHQLPPEPLLQWVRGHERFEFRDQLVVASERQVRLDPILERREPRLPQPPNRILRERFVGEVSKRLASPQRQRRAEPVLGARRIAVAKRTPPFSTKRLELSDVDIFGRDREPIAPALSRDHV